MKKNNVADLLHKKELIVQDRFAFCRKSVKATTSLWTHDCLLGHKFPGDVVISKIGLVQDFGMEKNDVLNLIGTLQLPVDKSIWVEVFEEDTFLKSVLPHAGFKYVGSKVLSTAEIIGFYFLDRAPERQFLALPPTEAVNIRPVMLPKTIHPEDGVIDLDTMKLVKPAKTLIDYVDETAKLVNKLNIDFQVHYSNYNYKKTWSALSLRGFSKDVTFIEKPSEMNDKWWDNHRNEKFEVQDTELMDYFFPVKQIMRFIPGEKERVRLMKLSKGNGALHRHTDLVDTDSGVADGKIMRLHFPIITNPDVHFYSWKLDGTMDVVTMEKGQCWYLDTRKPHAAVNNGDTDRIHLVIDVWANDELREMLMREKWETDQEPQPPEELPYDPYTNPNGKDPYDAD